MSAYSPLNQGLSVCYSKYSPQTTHLWVVPAFQGGGPVDLQISSGSWAQGQKAREDTGAGIHHWLCSCHLRKSLLKEKVMDLMTSTATLPLLFSCLGIFGLFRLLQWMRTKAYLRNAVVVITGATSGLGKECARAFHAAGAKLVLCGRNVEALEELTRELMASHASQGQTHKPYTVIFDLADTGATVAAAAEILQCFGYVDILINNAGISYRGTVMDTTVDVDKRVMETNYFGPIALTKALLPSMIKRRQGHIVAISSIQGKISIPFRSAYAASKHATQAFFDCLRAEMEQDEIQVTVISPGYIHTNLSVNAITADGSRYGAIDKNTAQGRSPAEVAQDVLAAVGKKKKDVILADLLPSLAIYVRTLAPELFFSIMAYRARKERKAKNS
ncbi:dehydrogenase/reductase SDR family member 7B isoform X1 [Sciurus carolinensis]|uniref:dehydrogenase/reductase SDR family member 7B isoform X1 n=1 Tax=Sciurus carolinensis TaxID=30640 RepID=UPI001FB517D0|nr:dehydrogenase/reductase SDR family member 7B isoform X1 [Sciurus carolinensis]